MVICELCGDKLKGMKKINLTSGEIICSDCKLKIKKDMHLSIFNLFKYSLDDIYNMYDQIGIDLKAYYSEKKAFLSEIDRSHTLFSKRIHILGGNNLIKTPDFTTIGQLSDGRIYFKENYTDFYYLISLDFEGAKYRTETVQTTKGTTNTKFTEKETKKGKSGKVAAGAVLGTIIAPGVGTLVGAYAGSKGKDKKKKKSKQTVSNEETIKGSTHEIEENSVCYLELVSLSDNKNIKIAVKAKTEDYHKLSSLEIKGQGNIPRDQAIEKLKELKELVELGILSEEDFDNRKKEYMSFI